MMFKSPFDALQPPMEGNQLEALDAMLTMPMSKEVEEQEGQDLGEVESEDGTPAEAMIQAITSQFAAQKAASQAHQEKIAEQNEEMTKRMKEAS